MIHDANALDSIIDHRLSQMDRQLAAKDSNYCRYELAVVAKDYAEHQAAPLLEELATKDARIDELDSFVNKVRGIKIEANEFSKGEQLGDEPDPLGYRNAMADIRTSLCQLLFDLDGPLLIKEKSGG